MGAGKRMGWDCEGIGRGGNGVWTCAEEEEK